MQELSITDKWVETGLVGIEFNAAYMPTALRCQFCEAPLPVRYSTLKCKVQELDSFEADIQYCFNDECRTLISMTPTKTSEFKLPVMWDLDNLIFSIKAHYSPGDGRFLLNKLETALFKGGLNEDV